MLILYTTDEHYYLFHTSISPEAALLYTYTQPVD